MCDVNSCNVFLLLFRALWVPISATLFKRAELTLWHAFLFLGLRFWTRTRNQPHIVRWGRSAKRQEVKVGPGTKNARNAQLNVAPGISQASESIAWVIHIIYEFI
jgi:hypothetical protein